jgi:hypothetical protein
LQEDEEKTKIKTEKKRYMYNFETRRRRTFFGDGEEDGFACMIDLNLSVRARSCPLFCLILSYTEFPILHVFIYYILGFLVSDMDRFSDFLITVPLIVRLYHAHGD